MSKISDEIRDWCDPSKDYIINGDYRDELRSIADRIDAEMVELPKDADGKPIHLGDTVYDLKGNEHTVFSLYLYEKAPTIDKTSPMWTVSFGFGTQIAPRDLTHERPDSLEHIADELDDWLICASNSHNFCQITDDSENALRDISDRIRKLAKEDK